MANSLQLMRDKGTALIYGGICHGLFLLAGLLMFICLYSGFSWQITPQFFLSSYAFNVLLLFQFPILHSFLLTSRGKVILRYFYSVSHKNKLDTTIYASIASFQLIILFLLWKPSGTLVWVADGVLYYVLSFGFVLGWLGLSLSSVQAGFSVQTGSLGWLAVYRGIKPQFPDMPTTGLFSVIRHPIYFSFSIILWISPYFTIDKLIIASLYSLYCFLAPLLKEKRFLKIYGDRFRHYQARTPYFIPKIGTLFKK